MERGGRMSRLTTMTMTATTGNMTELAVIGDRSPPRPGGEAMIQTPSSPLCFLLWHHFT
jgi:hypothetical protein